jgi:hypothetical protein
MRDAASRRGESRGVLFPDRLIAERPSGLNSSIGQANAFWGFLGDDVAAVGGHNRDPPGDATNAGGIRHVWSPALRSETASDRLSFNDSSMSGAAFRVRPPAYRRS